MEYILILLALLGVIGVTIGTIIYIIIGIKSSFKDTRLPIIAKSLFIGSIVTTIITLLLGNLLDSALWIIITTMWYFNYIYYKNK